MDSYFPQYSQALSIAEEALRELADGKSSEVILSNLDIGDLVAQAETVRRIREDLESANRIVGIFEKELEKRNGQS